MYARRCVKHYNTNSERTMINIYINITRDAPDALHMCAIMCHDSACSRIIALNCIGRCAYLASHSVMLALRYARCAGVMLVQCYGAGNAGVYAGIPVSAPVNPYTTRHYLTYY